ncbi:MAG: S9 family peptidase [Candidatus Aminicenantes bacterium]|nr:S9 family peptidase [Candidatus Aminicenantes bacterium]
MKKKVNIYLFILLLMTVGSNAEDQALRPMTIDDSLNMVQVRNVLFSPEGDWVFFSKTELDWKKNKYNTKYYMISSSGKEEAFQYIGDDGGSAFQFSPDGKHLSLKRTVDEHSQIFIMRTSGGEAVQLTKHKNSVGDYKWSLDSKLIFFIADEPRSEEDEKKFKAGYDSIFVDEGPNGQTIGRWKNLWFFDVNNKKETKLTDEEFILDDFDLSHDGKFILFTARTSNRRNDRNKSEIYLFDIASQEKTRLTENNVPEGNLQWAPDGKKFAYLSVDDQEWLNRNTKIYLMEIDSQKHRLLSGGFEGSIRNITWTPDSKFLYFNAQQKTNSNLYKVNVSNGEYRQITQITGTMQVNGFSRDRSKFLYTFSDYKTPADLYLDSTIHSDPQRLTDINPWFEKEILKASMKLVQWKSKNGFEIEGLLHLPSDFKQEASPPLILNIHGGPAGCFVNSFRPHYHIYAGLGYASLSPNVRGSSGYTDELQEGNTIQTGDGIGSGDYWDLINGIDHVIEKGYADPDRLSLKGWSYGGILGGWTITQTDRFKAASIGAGVYDWTSEYGPGFNYDVRLWHIGGTPWDNPEGYRSQSAFTHVKNVTTPTLLIHGMQDTTDTESQSMLFFTALKDIGRAPVRYLRVPREPHGFREPRHQRTRDIEEIKWMQKYVLGTEWTPWERPEDKDSEAKDKKPEKEKIN